MALLSLAVKVRILWPRAVADRGPDSPSHFLPAGRRVCDGKEKAMGIAITLQQFLEAQSVPYEVLEHKRTGCSARTADASHVPSESVAKGVVVKHKEGYILAIVPSRQVQLQEVGRWLDRPVALAAEEEVSALFPDCEHGAVPAIAAAYGLTAVATRTWRADRTSILRAAITAPSYT